MNYQETIAYLYQQLPVYEQVGGSAYKPGLERVETLLSLLGDPHKRLSAVHIAGTNGKGSTSSMVASILQEAGYRVGLFTSPHLVDFRERIRINGEMITEDYVVRFVADLLPKLPPNLKPSFFEFTTAMGFAYFADQGVEVAVIEVGMGGRLDSTNVLQPLVSVITNVTVDHAAYLGGTLREIATEKAGIIKKGTPVILGNSSEEDLLEVVTRRAEALGAPLVLADRSKEIVMYVATDTGGYTLTTMHYGAVVQPLEGSYQIENSATVFAVVRELLKKGLHISDDAVKEGIAKVAQVGLRGRLEVLQREQPKVVIDTGHNPGAWDYLSTYLEEWQERGGLVVVMGLAADKDADFILHHLPAEAHIVFTQAKSDRARPAEQLFEKASAMGLENIYAVSDMADAYERALEIAQEEQCGTLFIGGSNFIVGEFLQTVYKGPSEGGH